MARLQGDYSFKWGAESAAAWASGGPDGTLDGGICALSDEIDLSLLDNVVDVLVGALSQTAAGTLATNPYTQIYAAAPTNGNYPADSANYKRVGSGQVIAAADTAEYGDKWSLAAAYGGVLPNKFKLAMGNETGLALAGTAGSTNNKIFYEIVFANAQLT